MQLQSTLDVFYVTSAQIVRQASGSVAWYRIHLYGKNPDNAFVLNVFPSASFKKDEVPSAEEFFKFSPPQETPAQPVEASPAPEVPSTSESNSEL